jgi:hypothetical protein
MQRPGGNLARGSGAVSGGRSDGETRAACSRSPPPPAPVDGAACRAPQKRSRGKASAAAAAVGSSSAPKKPRGGAAASSSSEQQQPPPGKRAKEAAGAAAAPAGGDSKRLRAAAAAAAKAEAKEAKEAKEVGAVLEKILGRLERAEAKAEKDREKEVRAAMERLVVQLLRDEKAAEKAEARAEVAARRAIVQQAAAEQRELREAEAAQKRKEKEERQQQAEEERRARRTPLSDGEGGATATTEATLALQGELERGEVRRAGRASQICAAPPRARPGARAAALRARQRAGGRPWRSVTAVRRADRHFARGHGRRCPSTALWWRGEMGSRAWPQANSRPWMQLQLLPACFRFVLWCLGSGRWALSARASCERPLRSAVCTAALESQPI